MVNSNKPPKMKTKQSTNAQQQTVQQQQNENANVALLANESSQQTQKLTQNEANTNTTTPVKQQQKTQNGQQQQQTTPAATTSSTPAQTPKQAKQQQQQQKNQSNGNSNKNGNPSNNKGRNSVNNNNSNNSNSNVSTTNNNKSQNKSNQNPKNAGQKSNKNKQQSNAENANPGKAGKFVKSTSYRNSSHSYAQTVGGNTTTSSKKTYNKPQPLAAFNDNLPLPRERGNRNSKNSPKIVTNENQNPNIQKSGGGGGAQQEKTQISAGDLLTAALTKACAKCQKPTILGDSDQFDQNCNSLSHHLNPKSYRKSKSYVNSSRYSSNGDLTQRAGGGSSSSGSSNNNNNNRHQYHRSQSDRRSSFDRHFAERNKNFVPIEAPARPILASSNIAAVIADTEKMVIIERLGKGRHTYPIMQVSAKDMPSLPLFRFRFLLFSFNYQPEK